MSDQNGTAAQPRKSKHRPSADALRRLAIGPDQEPIAESQFVAWSMKHKLALKRTACEAINACFHRWVRAELGEKYELTTSTRPLLPKFIKAATKFVECMREYRTNHQGSAKIADETFDAEADWKLYTNAIKQIYKSMGYEKSEISAFDFHEPTQLERAIDIYVSQFYDDRKYSHPKPYSWSELGHLSDDKLSKVHRKKAELTAKSKYRTPPVRRRSLIIQLLRIIRKKPTFSPSTSKWTEVKSDIVILEDLYSLIGPEHGEIRDILWWNVKSDYSELGGNKFELKKQKEYDDIIKADAAALEKLESKFRPNKKKR